MKGNNVSHMQSIMRGIPPPPPTENRMVPAIIRSDQIKLHHELSKYANHYSFIISAYLYNRVKNK